MIVKIVTDNGLIALGPDPDVDGVIEGRVEQLYECNHIIWEGDSTLAMVTAGENEPTCEHFAKNAGRVHVYVMSSNGKTVDTRHFNCNLN